MVHHLGAVTLAQEALGHRHPDAVREALTEWARRRLDARREHVAEHSLRVAWGTGSPLAEALELGQRQVVAGQVKDAVEQHRAVSRREHEAVPVRPVGIGRIVSEHARVQEVGDRRHRHRQPGMAGVGLLDGVHRQTADRVDAETIELAAPEIVRERALFRESDAHDAASRAGTAAIDAGSRRCVVRAPAPPSASAAVAVAR